MKRHTYGSKKFYNIGPDIFKDEIHNPTRSTSKSILERAKLYPRIKTIFLYERPILQFHERRLIVLTRTVTSLVALAWPVL